MKIDFQFDTQYGMFSDALHLEDGVNYTNEEIEAIKQKRLANWISIIEASAQQSVVQE